MQKKIFLSVFSLLSCLSIQAEPSGRGFDPDIPDLGLPGGEEVLEGLLIAVIAIPIGYLILKAGDKKNSSDENLLPGCLGTLFIGGGLICLLPLVAWLCSILSAIFAIGLVVFVVVVIIALIFSKK